MFFFFGVVSVSAYTDDECRNLYGNDAIAKGFSSCGCREGFVFGFRTLYYDDTPVRLKRCVPAEEGCRSALGDHAYYDDETERCLCGEGFILDDRSDGLSRCVRAQNYCERHYGTESFYDADIDGCACRDSELAPTDRGGYACMTCADRFGVNSWLDPRTGACACKAGYALNLSETRCMPKPIQPVPAETEVSLVLYERVDRLIDRYLVIIGSRPRYEQIALLTQVAERADERIETTDSALKRDVYTYFRDRILQKIEMLRP